MRMGFLLILAPDSPHAVAELALSDSFFLTAGDLSTTRTRTSLATLQQAFQARHLTAVIPPTGYSGLR